MKSLTPMRHRALSALLTLFAAGAAPVFAQVNEPMHPILTISGSGSGASTVTNIAESAYTNNFIPHTPPRNSAQGFVPAVVSGDTGWSWIASAPNQITSTPSGTIFPNTNTAAYPVRTQAVTVFLTTATNNLTKSVNAIYYNKAGSTTSKSMVFNLIDYNKLNQLRSDLNKLAPAYINSGSTPATRNDNYARRIAIALLDWARWHPSYYLTAINSPTYINVTPNYLASTGGFGPQRASDHNGLAHEWQDDELLAFDAIYNSVGLTNMNAEMGFDVRQYISDNLFFDEGDFLVNHIPIDIAIQSNLSGPYAVLPQVARVLNRPDYIVWMDAYLDATVRQKIRRDGALEEGEGYSIGYLNSNQDAAQNTHDYFLTRAATNAAFLAISNRATIYNNTLTYGQAQWNTLSLPSGQLPAFGDTPYNNYFSSHSAGNSALLPAYGTLAMGAGSGSQAVQVNQNFSGDNNHMRADMCAFVLWAFNNPYLDNIRYYNGSIGRNFGEQMLAYNTITIDRANLTPYTDADTSGNGDLTIYEPGNNGLAMTEIDGQRAYSSKASRFQRLLLMNTVDLTKPYVVDVFRVTGGTTHDYTFHGAILWNQNWQCSFPLTTNSNPFPMLEGSETWDPANDVPYYGFWRNVSSNTAPGNFQITFSDTSASHRDTRLWMTADPNTYNVYLGTTPVPARDDTVPTNFFNSAGLVRPSAIIRHRIPSGTLQDLFVSVVEPFNAGVSNIVSVTRLPMSGTANESVGLKIAFKDGRVDTYIVNLRNPQIAGATGGSATVSTIDGQYSLTGRVGLQVDRSTGGSRVFTMNATDFKYAGRELSTSTNTYFSGLIAGETRKLTGGSNDAFTTTSPLPLGTALRNKWMSFTHGALSGTGTTGISEMFKIDQVIFTNGLYNICFTNDHYLEITNGTTSAEQVAPLRTFTTSNSFEIALSASAQQISPLADVVIPPGGSSGPVGFTFGDLGTTAGASLQIITNSSNEALVPENLITVGGSGTNRTINVAAVVGQTGSSVITVSVTDGVWTNSRSFTAFVNDFALNATPASQAVTVGGATSFNATVVATNGFGDLVTFDVTGIPANAGASFTPPTITGSGSTTLNVVVSNNAAPGTYPLTLTATSGSLSSTDSVTLVVNPVVIAPGLANWTGGSAVSANWSANANWGGTPLVSGSTLAFNGIAQVNNTNDTAAGTIYSNIVFNPGAGAFVLNGNSITLIGGITNNSSNPQTVALGILFSNNITLNGASNTLVIAGGLTNTFVTPGSTTVTLAGTGEIKNLLKSTASLGGTNLMLLNSSTADWTLLDNDTSALMTVPWAFAVNNGSFTFGDDDDAPRLTSTTPNGIPQDNQVGTVSGATGTFNMVNGTLTTSGRWNTATAANSTGVINQTGGTWNLGNQFQGANGGNAGELSVLNVSGGVLNIGTAVSPTSPLYVASRGTGTLSVSGSGIVSCGKLDISRNAAGNTISSSGTVNLDGGALLVTSVTNISANQQTGGSPTATFNFNGGTLVAKSGASTMFFQGSTAAPITPIQTFVKIGGAIIDDGGNTITIGEPLKHDAALGSAADGGLTKTNLGKVTLIGTNTYNGDTLVNAGILALAGNGSISNSPALNISAGATLDASARADGRLTVVAGQSLVGNGAVNGNVTVVAGATLAPGLLLPTDNGGSQDDTNDVADVDPVGTLTFSNNLTLNSGCMTLMDVNKAPSTNDAVNVTGLVTYGGTLSLTIGDTLSAVDSFKLFAAGSYSGVFASIVPATPGPGLAWNTNTLASDGTLRITTVALLVPPMFAGIIFSGGNIIMNGSNGLPGTNYYVLASTNLSLPFSNWDVVGTDAFDVNGNFQFTNDLGAWPQRYYILRLP